MSKPRREETSQETMERISRELEEGTFDIQDDLLGPLTEEDLMAAEVRRREHAAETMRKYPLWYAKDLDTAEKLRQEYIAETKRIYSEWYAEE